MDRTSHDLPPIPAKRYFTIGEVSELCRVKPYVLRYWEQEFVQLKPMKRRGNRRYYQHHEVLLVRRIRELLYEQGFTISGARNRLTELGHAARAEVDDDDHHDLPDGLPVSAALIASERLSGGSALSASRALQASPSVMAESAFLSPELPDLSQLSPEAAASLRLSLLSIRDLLS
jgi:DNA-binding transcriptional MerR regulator